MSWTKLFLPCFLWCIAIQAQNAETPAVQLQTLLAQTPRLPVERAAFAFQPPNPEWALGAVSSVASDGKGVAYVLHRGDKADPIVAVNAEGRVLRSWGKGMYTVPHSVRVDPDGNVWTVDAGNSVLLKFTPEGKKLQEISVGEVAPAERCAFPTLCGTTDVTFGPNRRLFISDGYGNARILEYTADGKRLRAWGSSGRGPGQFQIPHGIAFDGKGVLFVADRTNTRIQRFDLEGRYLGEWTHLGRPFALKFTGGSLWAAIQTLEPAGQGAGPRSSTWLLKVDPATGKPLGKVESTGPHSIDVSVSEELVASGCCGGTNPNGIGWFRRPR